MKKLLRRFFNYWKDNFERPSTWMGIMAFCVAVSIYNDKDVLHDFLHNLVKNSEFMGVIIGVISGALIVHKQNKRH